MLSAIAQSRETKRLACRLGMLLLLFCCSGATCSRSLRNPFTPAGPPAPEVLLPGATLDQVIAAVNQNAARVQTYQTNNATITIVGDATLPALRGNIAAEPPNKLRFQASTALTGAEVDLGSNDELFWFWVKRNEPPAVYFSRHNQFAGSAAQQVMPVEPSWLLDALGFTQFKPSDLHQPPVAHGNGMIEIHSTVQSRIGQLNKNTVIDARRAWIIEQHIYDGRGTLLASAVARSHQYYPAQGVSLPQEIDIRLPVAQLSLVIDVGTVQLNQPMANPALWELPAMNGYPQIDLGTAPPNTISAIGAPGSNDWSTGAGPGWLGFEQGAISATQYDRPYVAPNIMPPVIPTSASSPAQVPQYPAPTQFQSLPVGGTPLR